MHVAHPIRGVIPSLDGPVIEVLAGTTRTLTGREVHRLAGVGSVRGVRLVLARLVAQGLVIAEERGGAILYVGNRDHLAWSALESLAHVRSMLLDRIAADVAAWPIAPAHVSLFGSAARGDGDAASDIDLLIVHPEQVGTLDRGDEQVDRLREGVHAWTGNRCQAVDIGRTRLSEHVRARDPIVAAWLADGLLVFGEPLEQLVGPPLGPENG